jgi:hypothetical protein
MQEKAIGRSFCWFIVLVLTLVLILGVLPCAAEETYTLQDLIANGTVIHIDNLEFSNFAEQYFYPVDLVRHYEEIDVEIVGACTNSPGLRFTPKPDSTEWSRDVQGTQYVVLSYDVKVIDGSPMIIGSRLILEPGNVVAVVPVGSFSIAKVEDKGTVGSNDKFWVQRHNAVGSSGVNIIEDTLQGESEFLGKAMVSPDLFVALSLTSPEGEAAIQSFEHRVLLPVEGRPIANAGSDQAVFDQVSLNGSDSSPADATYQWELYQKGENGWEFSDSAPGVQAEFTNLVNGFYEARLKVTNSLGVSAVDTAIIAAAGPPGAGTEPGNQTNAELNLWHFELKKYKYCKWSIARMLGTFDLPDNFKFDRGDDLVGKVTVQINRGEQPLIFMSDDLKLKAKNWRYKSVIRSH